MAIALNTILAEDLGAEFMPTGEVMLQAIGDPSVVVDVEARVDVDADWSPVTSWSIRSSAFCRLAQFPRMRVRVRGNTAGKTVMVRYSA